MITEVGVERAFQNNLAVCKQFRFLSFFFLFFEEERFIPTFLQYSISSYFIHDKDNGTFRRILFLYCFMKKPNKTNKPNLTLTCWGGECKGMEIAEIAGFSRLTVGWESLLKCWPKYLIQQMNNFHIHSLRVDTTFLCLKWGNTCAIWCYVDQVSTPGISD